MGKTKFQPLWGRHLETVRAPGMSGGRLRGRLRKLLLERAVKDDRGSLGRQGQTGRGEKVGGISLVCVDSHFRHHAGITDPLGTISWRAHPLPTVFSRTWLLKPLTQSFSNVREQRKEMALVV